jgi:hypothetical protein
MTQFLFVMVTWIGLMHDGTVSYQVVWKVVPSKAACLIAEQYVHQVFKSKLKSYASKAECIELQIET